MATLPESTELPTMLRTVTLPLQADQRYLQGDGRQVNIVGPTRSNPDYMYSLQGDWYDAASGARVGFTMERGRYLFDVNNWRSIAQGPL